jgi:outer membrane protease
VEKIIRTLSVSVLLAAAAASSQAQVYVEGAYAPLTLKVDDADLAAKAKPAALTGIVGYNINPNLDVEGLVGLGVKKSNLTFQGESTSVKAEITSSIGAFLKPKFQLNDEVEVFARVGYVYSKLKLTAGGASESASEGSFAYGLGGNYYLNKQTYLTASYMGLYNKDSVKVDGFNLGVGFKF